MTLLEALLPVAALYWSMHTAVLGPVEVIPVPNRIWQNSAAYDGDTLQLKADNGSAMLVFRVRVEDLDTPEVKSKCPEERRLADIAKREADAFISRGPIVLTHVSPKLDDYGRLLARVAVRFPSGQLHDLSDHLKADPRGIARGYDEGTGRLPWC
jgi:hypothetical protein